MPNSGERSSRVTDSILLSRPGERATALRTRRTARADSMRGIPEQCLRSAREGATRAPCPRARPGRLSSIAGIWSRDHSTVLARPKGLSAHAGSDNSCTALITRDIGHAFFGRPTRPSLRPSSSASSRLAFFRVRESQTGFPVPTDHVGSRLSHGRTYGSRGLPRRASQRSS